MTELPVDVMGLGACAVDHFWYVASFPQPDSKTPAEFELRQCGGLTATALVAAARLGTRAAYAGRLGEDESSHFVEHSLAAEGVDLRHVQRDPEWRPYQASVLVDTSTGSRTIVFRRPDVHGPSAQAPAAEVIRGTKVLLVDHMGIPGQIRAAGIAREAGIAVVADIERPQPGCEELLALCDHPILPFHAARTMTGAETPQAAAEALWNEGRETVVVTTGAEGLWYRTRGVAQPRQLPAFPVKVVDTTGCGDVFHGAYCAALALGLEVETRLRWGAAAAALKAMQPGGQTGIPRREELEAFLAARQCGSA